jgi:O-antigen/teichoic acid export membrane protein
VASERGKAASNHACHAPQIDVSPRLPLRPSTPGTLKTVVVTVRKSLAWSFGQQATQYALQFASSIIIARLLTPAEVGVFALAISASYLLSALRGAGVGLYLVREPALDDSKIRSAFGVMLIVSCLLGLVMLALREPAALLYGEPAMAPVLALISVTFFMAPFGQPALSLLTREMRFDVLYRIALLSTVVGTSTSISLAFVGFSYFALAWGSIASTAITALLALLHKPGHLKLLPSLSHGREVFRFGGLLTATNLVGTATVEGIKFVLGALQAPAAVALYERAGSLPFMARQALFAPLGSVLLPAYSRAMREGQPITDAVLRVAGATTVIIWPAFTVIGILSISIIVTLFGENWRIAGDILPYILLAHALLAALPQPDAILVPSGHVGRLLLLRLFGLFVFIGIAAIGASVSLKVFAQLLPIAPLLFIIASYASIRRVCGISIRGLGPRYVKAFLIAGVSAVPAVAARVWNEGDVPVVQLAAVAVTTPLLWFASLALLRHDLINELQPLLQALKSMLKRQAGSVAKRN